MLIWPGVKGDLSLAVAAIAVVSEAENSSSLCFCPIIFKFSYRPLK